MSRGAAETITRRQRELVARSAELRSEFATQLAVLRQPLALGDRLRAGAAWLRAHPEWPIGLGLVVIVLRPRRAWRWGLRLWWAWRAWRRVERWALPRMQT